MRSHLLAAALALLAPWAALGEDAADQPPRDVYIRWRLGAFLPTTRVSRDFAFDPGPGVSLGAATGLQLGPHLALEAELGYCWARLNQSATATGAGPTSLDDLWLAGSLVGRLGWDRLEVAAKVGAGLDHPTVAALYPGGPDVALSGRAGLLASYQVWTQARLGVEAEQVVLRPRFGPRTLRLDGLHLALTLTHRW
jgi:hypothetical protein